MANKEIHYLSDGGSMFWPATTTTAIIDPTSRKTLPEILSKLVSVGNAGNISATVLPPIVLESISTNSTGINGINLVGKTYYCPDLSKIRHYYSGQAGQITPEDTDPSSELIYYEKTTDKFYRWDSTNQGMISIMLGEPTYVDINLADCDSSNTSAFSTTYHLPSSDVLPESIFIEGNDRYKKVILRVRVLNEDNLDGSAPNNDDTYWNFSIELIPFTPRNTDDTWNNGAAFLFGSYTYYGTIYSAYVYYDGNGNCSIMIEKIQLDKLGTITNISAYSDMPSYPAVGDNINTAFSKTNRIIRSHEEITARALLDLDSRVQSLTGNLGIQEITWSSLKTLRDGGNLVPGSFYKITDYTCTTTQINTQSAGHLFDIIVLALSESTLSETAWADHHEGDTYFSDCKLEAWELKYCLDNDITRFAWVDSTNGKGVIYYMKDEWNNDCPYDFKNIQFKRFKITACSQSPSMVGSYSSNNVGNTNITLDSSTPYYAYTFCMLDGNIPNDVSVKQEEYLSDEGYCYHTYDNHIKECYESFYLEDTDQTKQMMMLPDIVFVTDTVLTNIEEDYGEFYGFYSNTFGNGCSYNTFGNDCSSITFGNYCSYNTFGNYCSSNIFGNNCSYNIFGSADSNTFGDSCSSNVFGESCGSNTFGVSCNSNTFGDDCSSNTFMNYCFSNTFVNYCSSNTFGNDCSYNTFIKSYTKYVIVECGNQKITLTSTQSPTNSNPLCNITIAQGVNNSDTTKTISHDTLNDNFQTIYKPVNSVEISV